MVGSAFFCGSKGCFLTARHVMDQATAEAEKEGWLIGLCAKADNGQSVDSVIYPLSLWEFAAHPYDIAIGRLDYFPGTPLFAKSAHVGIFEEVRSLGYPSSVHVKDGDALWLNLRGQNGQVQRLTLPRDMISSHPDGFELSFLLSPGMSGCPVYTLDGNVIGVGVGSFGSRIVEHELSEVDDNGHKFTEQRLRIEEFGFAHDLRGLLDWTPELLGGMKLSEALGS
nr:serine protease [Rhizobium paranaense]